MTELTLYAEPQHVERIEDCLFYHVMDIPGVGTVGNDPEARHGWDLRGHLLEYLGGLPLDGRRVLEVGPASGFLTFEMESRGATVVAVEISPESQWDIVPHAGIDYAEVDEDRQREMGDLRRGFWFAHEHTRSRSQVHYGNGRSLPPELGRFDVATLAAVLLHNRDPLAMISQCAALTDEIVLVERHHPDLDGSPVARLYPTAASSQWDTWWDFSPELFVAYLEVLGFSDTTVSFHEQTHVYPHGSAQMPMFTVIGRRNR